MLNTYKAVLQGDRLEWVDEVPEELAGGKAVPAHITILEEKGVHLLVDEHRGQRMAEALEQLATTGAMEHVDDPVGWQRELREDGRLPGREV